MEALRSLLAVAICSSVLAGCGSKSPVTTPPPPSGPQPITADPESWTWVDFPDSRCADGNPTGLAVNLTTRSPNALIFLMGGGACWDYATCYQSSTAVYIDPGFEGSDMPFLTIEADAVGVTSRDNPKNPFKDYSFVAVPYCTGDAFTGDNTMVYDGHPTVHAGHANIMAYLKRIVPTFPDATRIAVVGVSAGGIGAAFNWWHIQQAFGSIRVDLIDDSGPALPAPYLAPSLVQTWNGAWGLEKGLPPDCTECKTALDALITYTANANPGRGALLDFTQDSVLPGFMNITTAQFGMGLDALAKQRLDGLPRVRYFFADQSDHVLLPHPDLSQNGVNLWDWVNLMESDDPSWQSVHP